MNCKPGDLAFTVNAPQENGFIVEVGAAAGVHERLGLLYWITSKGSPFHLTPDVLRHTVLWPDTMLRPIRPGDVTDDEVRELYAPKLPEVA